jgi:hypothetical protein
MKLFNLRYPPGKFFLVPLILAGFFFAACSNPAGNDQTPDPSPPTFNLIAKAITAFSFTNLDPPVEGDIDIDVERSTVLVRVPGGTDLTNLVPAIEVSAGAKVSPAPGVGRDFSGPVVYTVTAENGSTAKWTVTVKEDIRPGIRKMIAAGDPSAGNNIANPLSLSLNINLTVPGNWKDILSVIGDTGKYVALDLSDCTITAGGEFDPDNRISAGKDRVVSLVLPGTASSIRTGSSGASPFRYFTSLTSASGENVKSIGAYAFSGCSALASVDFPLIISIGSGAFEGCSALASVDFPLITSIGSEVFKGCSTLVSADFPGVTVINSGTFSGCTALASLSLSSARNIGQGAFAGCIGLTSVNLPLAGYIGDSAFFRCKALETLNLPEAAYIGNSAFSGCSALSTLSLPKVENMGNNAFFDCSTLLTLDLPKTKSIGNAAFANCRALETLDLPETVSIGDGAFLRCVALSALTFAKAESIGRMAFVGCTALTALSLPASLASIANDSFSSCSNLTTITVDPANSGYSAQDGMLLSKDGKTLVTYPSAGGTVTLNGVTAVGDYAFSGCIGLTSAAFPDVTSVGDQAFSGCIVLSTVSLPAVENIGRNAFSGCIALTSATFPAAVNVGDLAFLGCTVLSTVNLSATTSIGAAVFANTGSKALTVILGSTVPALGTNIFSGVTAAKTVTVRVPAGVAAWNGTTGSFSSSDTAASWGNGFRGGGWDGSAMTNGSLVNRNIWLAIGTYTP